MAGTDKIKVVIIGDSMTDDEGGADQEPAEGYLAKALVEILPEWGYEIGPWNVYGVGGSTLDQWLINAGQTGTMFRMPGRWADTAQNPLTDEADDRTDLRTIIKNEAPDAWWVNFGTNDAATLYASGKTSDADIERWMQDVRTLVDFLPGPVVWSLGNGSPDKPWTSLKRRMQVALALGLPEKATAILDDPANAWDGQGVHPSLQAQRVWVRSQESTIRAALDRAAEGLGGTHLALAATGVTAAGAIILSKLLGWW